MLLKADTRKNLDKRDFAYQKWKENYLQKESIVLNDIALEDLQMELELIKFQIADLKLLVKKNPLFAEILFKSPILIEYYGLNQLIEELFLDSFNANVEIINQLIQNNLYWQKICKSSTNTLYLLCSKYDFVCKKAMQDSLAIQNLSGKQLFDLTVEYGLEMLVLITDEEANKKIEAYTLLINILDNHKLDADKLTETFIKNNVNGFKAYAYSKCHKPQSLVIAYMYYAEIAKAEIAKKVEGKKTKDASDIDHLYALLPIYEKFTDDKLLPQNFTHVKTQYIQIDRINNITDLLDFIVNHIPNNSIDYIQLCLVTIDLYLFITKSHKVKPKVEEWTNKIIQSEIPQLSLVVKNIDTWCYYIKNNVSQDLEIQDKFTEIFSQYLQKIYDREYESEINKDNVQSYRNLSDHLRIVSPEAAFNFLKLIPEDSRSVEDWLELAHLKLRPLADNEGLDNSLSSAHHILDALPYFLKVILICKNHNEHGYQEYYSLISRFLRQLMFEFFSPAFNLSSETQEEIKKLILENRFLFVDYLPIIFDLLYQKEEKKHLIDKNLLLRMMTNYAEEFSRWPSILSVLFDQLNEEQFLNNDNLNLLKKSLLEQQNLLNQLNALSSKIESLPTSYESIRKKYNELKSFNLITQQDVDGFNESLGKLITWVSQVDAVCNDEKEILQSYASLNQELQGLRNNENVTETQLNDFKDALSKFKKFPEKLQALPEPYKKIRDDYNELVKNYANLNALLITRFDERLALVQKRAEANQEQEKKLNLILNYLNELEQEFTSKDNDSVNKTQNNVNQVKKEVVKELHNELANKIRDYYSQNDCSDLNTDVNAEGQFKSELIATIIEKLNNPNDKLKNQFSSIKWHIFKLLKFIHEAFPNVQVISKFAQEFSACFKVIPKDGKIKSITSDIEIAFKK